MKKGLIVILTIISTIGALFFGVGTFCRTIEKPENLKMALAYLDISAIIQEEMGEEYAFFGDLLNTTEFKAILSSYTDGLVTYIVEGKEEIPITKEQVRDLFTNYSSTLLQQYPHLSFLPTDKFVDFLVENVDLTEHLPQYHEVVEKIPEKYLVVIQVLESPVSVALSLAVFLCFAIALMVVSPRRSYFVLPLMIICLGVLFGVIGFGLVPLDNLTEVAAYPWLKPFLTHLLSYFIPLSFGYMGTGVIFLMIGYFILRRHKHV